MLESVKMCEIGRSVAARSGRGLNGGLGIGLGMGLGVLVALGLGGCGGTKLSGFRVDNKTEQIVRVELLQLEKTGEMKAFSTQTLSPGGEFVHLVDESDFRRGMRARFVLAGDEASMGNWVMFNIAENRERRYELQLVNGRLSAKDLQRRDR